jgi:hypothetical protein
MDPFNQAIEQLLAAAGSASDGALQDTYEGLGAVLEEAEHAPKEACDQGLRRLAEVIATTDVTRAALVALGCGALVESAGEPRIALGAVLDRLPQVLAAAATFAEVCRELAAVPAPAAEERGRQPRGGPDDAGSYVDQFAALVADERPEEAQAWTALEPLCMGAIAMLSRSVAARRDVRSQTALLACARPLAPLHARVAYLTTLLQVLDDEELLVLHPSQVRGYRLRMHGIATNYQLHTLLADTLIGDPAQGWLPGQSPNPRVAAAARNQLANPSARTAAGAFDLFSWRGLRPDGTLPGSAIDSAHAIRNRAIPADIPAFEGVRVLLLRPITSPRTWNAGRTFEGMDADLRVLDVLSPTAVQEWLDRLRRAAQET